jgi:hypothetical protein
MLTKSSFASIFLYSSRKYILCSLNFLDNALPFSDRENVVIFDSYSKKNMEQVENYLKLDPKRRDASTNQLITTFSLSENGKALSKKLREQNHQY